MSQTVWDNILATSYLLCWVATLVWYQWKSRVLDGGTAIISTYVLYAVFSILTLNDPVFSYLFNPLSVFPYIFLFVMLLLALSPVIFIHIHPAKEIENPHTRVLTLISIIVIGCSFILIPNILENFGSGIVKLFTDADAGKDAYMEQAESASETGSGISNIPAILHNMFADIAIFIFFYFLTLKKKNWWLITLLFFSIIIGLFIPIIQGSRSNIILAILTIIVGYMMFRQYIEKKLNRIIQIAGLSFVIVTSLPVAAITMSRFESLSAGVAGFFNWYVGQGSLYFNNFALDAGGTRHGDRTLNLLKRVLDSDTPQNYVERREKYHNLNVDDDIFTTFVGDFVIDFGPYLAVVIFIVFNLYVIYQIRPHNGKLQLHQTLLLFFVECICMQGGMYLFAYSDTGNLRILVAMILYAYLRYHEKLLEKFSLVETIEEQIIIEEKTLKQL